MKTVKLTTYRDGGLWGYRIYHGTKKIAQIVAQHNSQEEALDAAYKELDHIKNNSSPLRAMISS